MKPTCPACDSPLEYFDSALVMERYEATYYRCPRCLMVHNVETPWLEESYSNAIHTSDTGLLRRAQKLSAMTSAVLRFEGLRDGRFLDWAGGYGVFTQMMRDKGFDYWQHDDYATPLFAAQFGDDGEGDFELITAFEVMEHLADPRTQLAPIAARTERMLFTTCLLPSPTPRVADWWYYMPTVGQHISFHTVDSLQAVAEHLGFRLTSNGSNWHMFHREPLRLGTRTLLSSRAIRGGRSLRDLPRRVASLRN